MNVTKLHHTPPVKKSQKVTFSGGFPEPPLPKSHRTFFMNGPSQRVRFCACIVRVRASYGFLIACLMCTCACACACACACVCLCAAVFFAWSVSGCVMCGVFLCVVCSLRGVCSCALLCVRGVLLIVLVFSCRLACRRISWWRTSLSLCGLPIFGTVVCSCVCGVCVCVCVLCVCVLCVYACCVCGWMREGGRRVRGCPCVWCAVIVRTRGVLVCMCVCKLCVCLRVVCCDCAYACLCACLLAYVYVVCSRVFELYVRACVVCVRVRCVRYTTGRRIVVCCDPLNRPSCAMVVLKPRCPICFEGPDCADSAESSSVPFVAGPHSLPRSSLSLSRSLPSDRTTLNRSFSVCTRRPSRRRLFRQAIVYP